MVEWISSASQVQWSQRQRSAGQDYKSYSRYGSNYGYGQYLSKIRINTHRLLYDDQKSNRYEAVRQMSCRLFAIEA